MKQTYKSLAVCVSALAATLLIVTTPGFSQSDEEKAKAKAAAKAKQIAEIFEANARVLTLFDRQGKMTGTAGERGLYSQPILSPDRSKIAVIQVDLNAERSDLWVVDVATGKSTRITTSQSREQVRGPAWSPDGSQVAYVALKGGTEGVYRNLSSGQNKEELLYKHGGFGANLTDWSMDGRYLCFFTSDLAGSVLFALPTAGEGERKPIELFKSKAVMAGPRLSPDSRYVSYMSNETGRNEVYVRNFDSTATTGPWRITTEGGQGMAFWRRDGREFFYLAPDRAVMSVEVSTAPQFEFGKPKVLFRPSEDTPIAVGIANVGRDGQGFLFALPTVSQLRHLTVYDRQGKVVKTVGEPGLYTQANLSPDGTKIVVMRSDLKKSQNDIWTFDIATGKGNPVTDDTHPDNAPIWSPDGKQVAWVSTRGNFSSIYRRNWDGTGSEEQVFQYTPGAGLVLTDWSPDNKFMTFYTGVVVMVPLAGKAPEDRKAIDWLREEYEATTGRFSPDMRHVAYMSNEIDVDNLEVYIRPFDANKADTLLPGAVQVSKNKAVGVLGWRADGKELYFLSRDWEVMAVDVTTTPSLQVSAPKVLFKMQGPLSGNPTQWKNVSADGQRFVFAVK